MSEDHWKYSSGVEIRLSLKSGEVFVEFCDAGTWQWMESLGMLSDYGSPEDLVIYVRDAIDNDLNSLTYSLVDDLFKNVLKEETE